MPERFIVALFVVRTLDNRPCCHKLLEASVYLMLGQERKEELPFVA
tara:strand:- start:1417 stop:1554 length:138 start_codon:yes stop_codon:yes gene_type:complete